MYNPLPLLNERLLADKIKKGKKYFVRQTYKRGYQPHLKAAFLFRAYEAGEKELAEKHLSLVSGDGNAFLYDVANPEHLEKLHIAASQPFGYKVYYAGRRGIEWKPPAEYQNKIREFIRIHHPAWRTQKGGDRIGVGLHEEFGQLFLKFNFDKEEDKMPFDDIEKY